MASKLKAVNIVESLGKNSRTRFEIVKILVVFELEKNLFCVKVMPVGRVVINIEILGVGVLYILFGVRSSQ